MSYNRNRRFRPQYQMPKRVSESFGARVVRSVVKIVTLVTVKRRRPRWYKANADLLLTQMLANAGAPTRRPGTLTLGDRPRPARNPAQPAKLTANYAGRLAEVG